MFCPKCGSPMQEGRPCPCGAPMLSSNPAVNILKTVGSSTVFLMAAIFYTLEVLVTLVSSFMPSALDQFIYTLLTNLQIDPSVFVQVKLSMQSTWLFSMLAALIPEVLIAVSLWITFGSSKNRNTGTVSTAGMTICKVLSILSVILLALCIVVLVVFGIILLVVGGTESGNAAAVFTMLGIYLLVYTLVVVFLLFYQIAIVKTINSVKRTALLGYPDTKVSTFVIVMLYITGIDSIIGGIIFLVFSPLLGISSLCSAVAIILIAVALGQYKKKITMLAYAMPGMPGGMPPYGAQQPPYGAQPPMQGM